MDRGENLDIIVEKTMHLQVGTNKFYKKVTNLIHNFLANPQNRLIK